MRERVGHDVEATVPVVQIKVMLCKVCCPPCLSSVEFLRFPEVLEVFMVCPDVELWAVLDEGAEVLEGEDNCE